jgi:hypothetical protein
LNAYLDVIALRATVYKAAHCIFSARQHRKLDVVELEKLVVLWIFHLNDITAKSLFGKKGADSCANGYQ